MMDTAAVDPSNDNQARSWDGPQGAYWATNADRFDRAIVVHHHAFMAAAAIAGGETVLDIGCGTGQSTREAARHAAGGSALGIDLSSLMIDLARQIAADEGVGNASFELADAQIHPFETASFDVAISRTGAMFFGDPPVAFANVARCLRPGGRLALLTWQAFARNEWISEFARALTGGGDPPPPGVPGPFSLADPDHVRHLLEGAGFADIRFEALAAPMSFGAGSDEAYDFVFGLAGWMADRLDDDGRTRALAALRESIRAHETADGVNYDSAAWIVTARKGATGA